MDPAIRIRIRTKMSRSQSLVKLDWWGWGLHAHPLSLYQLYHHIQSSGVRSSWEGRYPSLYFSSTPICSLWMEPFPCTAKKLCFLYLSYDLKGSRDLGLKLQNDILHTQVEFQRRPRNHPSTLSSQTTFNIKMVGIHPPPPLIKQSSEKIFLLVVHNSRNIYR